MKKNRLEEKNSFSAEEQALNKSSSENILVFLVLATMLLAVNIFYNSHHFLQQKVFSAPQKDVFPNYVWFTGSSEITEGLYQFSPGQLKKRLPEIHALLLDTSPSKTNPLVSAVILDPAKVRIIALPPNVANIFFQPIPINRADKTVLTSLPGIGQVLAEKIVERRKQHGPFRSKADLMNVGGIGPKKFGALVEHITID